MSPAVFGRKRLKQRPQVDSCPTLLVVGGEGNDGRMETELGIKEN